MSKKLLFSLLFFSCVITGKAQTTYLPTGSEDNHLLDRLETRSGRFSDTLCLMNKPVSRQRAVLFLEHVRDSANRNLSGIDQYNLAHAISENGEWAADETGAIDSKHPIFNFFYKKEYDFVYVKTRDFFMVANPVLSAQGIVEQGSSKPLFSNSRGIELRGWISKKIGFYTSCVSNDETPPSFVTNYIESKKALPGADYYVNKPGYFNYLQASGYFDFAIVKNHLNATMGYGKNFIGDGVTSLFLSDASSGYPFLKLTTHIWKFNYQNLFVQLTPQFKNKNTLLEHKYASIHQLNVNLTRWLNVGFFEAVVFGREGNYDISYMNPIIYYRATEQANGSPDNELVGYNFKLIAAKHLQFYGQVLLDEFQAKELLSNRGFWANKWGVQAGCKYFDVFGIKNLDAQGEINVVRPYTYSHSDTVANYTNYNQPLANPLGSGFEQVICIASYQPVRNVTVTVKGMYYIKGADTGSTNYGNNIFQNYKTRDADYGVGMINGINTHCISLNLDLSYQVRRNMFIDLGATKRNFVSDYRGQISSTTGLSTGDYSKTYIYFGVRLNAAKRNYDFF